MNCPDFAEERSVLQELLDKNNDIVLLSPKCHPELAGNGIEYCIGFAKMQFRRIFNNGIGGDSLTKNTFASLESITMEHVWKYSRRSRDYLHVYNALHDQSVDNATNKIDLTGECNTSHQMLEDMRKTRKTHRNILDIEYKFLKEDLIDDKQKPKPTEIKDKKRINSILPNIHKI